MIEVKPRKFIPYFMSGIVAFIIGYYLTLLYSVAPNSQNIDIIDFEKIEWVLDNILNFSVVTLSTSIVPVYVGFLCFMVVMILFLRVKRTGVYRRGEEHGSAKYSSFSDLKGYEDEEERNNMILSQNVKIGLFNDRLPYNKQVNKNMCVYGGSGDGKTYTFVKPNALQLNASKVYTDTKGVLVNEMGYFFEKMGYKLKIFDLIGFVNSDRFNVFNYMRKETDIDRVATAIVTATKKSDNSGEDFWVQAELLLMRALIGYLYFDSKISGYVPNLPQITDLIRYIRREDPDIKSPVELMFEELEVNLPGNFANKQWDLFNRNFDGDTRKSVLAVIASRFSVFDHDEVRQLLEVDTLEIDTWNIEKTAVFINIPETNDAYQFISSLLFSTMFDTSIRVADNIIKGERKVENGLLHLEIYGDEFANIGKIPDLEKYISVIRSREISLKMMIQSESQLDDLYGKEKRKTILNNCGTILYLGTNDRETAETFSVRAGKQTLQDDNQSETRSHHGSTSTQHSKMARDLLTAHEIMTVPYDEVLIFINRNNVARDKKANVREHKFFNYLAFKETDKNWYRYVRYMNDIDEFLSNVKPSNLVEVTEEEIEAFAS